ncbi:hypothetical protein GCM10008959_23980 [Deinococcus seoulensis]|uniref:Peptidase S8/S53 domain-containing protein n=1 Tax=Deinococcus seoulensis TaxID=1837379 RepID=A0ABQ2RVR3_9DEIO|nr:S8/S53 family peptidase [Deinococcus seoulensis]GGR61233.1 hypothetical protein GCM10008959_23980 [Deinococcus seoulensis]
MNQALTAVLIALLLSVARAAIPVEEIYPSQVAPGGLIEITIPPQRDVICRRSGTPLSVWIGSRPYAPACEPLGADWVLTFRLPKPQPETSPPVRDLRLPQEGLQGVVVLPAGERLTASTAATVRNLAILPPGAGVLVIQKNGKRGLFPSNRPFNLSILFAPGFRGSNHSAAVSDQLRRLEESVRDIDLKTVYQPSVGKLFPDGSLCGDTVVQGGQLPDEVKADLGMLIEQAERKYGGSIVVAPDTAKQPPGGQEGQMLRRTEGGNELAWQAIGLAPLVISQRIRPVTVHTIDTFDGTTDNYTHQTQLNGLPYTMRGHGRAIDQLIRTVAPVTSRFEYTPACDAKGTCRVVQIIEGLCQAVAAVRSQAPVIVNLSFATPYDHPILRQAVQEALQAGVAVVTAYGNSDRCALRASSLLDYCNAYPADWTTTMEEKKYPGRLYAVGASEQGNATPQNFQRGEARWSRENGQATITQHRMSVATQPTVLAPAFFWLTPPGMQAQESPSPGAYWGTSFAAPLVTGALVRWVQSGHQGWPTPSQLQCRDARLDLRRITDACP